MESVALLKQENRKLLKQLKDATATTVGSDAAKSGSSGASKTPSQREVAKLSVENEMLTE